MYQCLCGFKTENGRAYSAHFKHYKGDLHKRLGWIDTATGEIFPTRPRTTKTSSTTGQVVTHGTIQAAGLGGARPPIVFELGEERIPLNWQPLYEAYQYYDDLKREEGLQGGFAETILGCLRFVWKMTRVHPRIEGKEVTVEVSHGGRNRGIVEEKGRIGRQSG